MHKPCAEPGCATLAVFNQPGTGHGLFCGQHKPAGYVNVKVQPCPFVLWQVDWTSSCRKGRHPVFEKDPVAQPVVQQQ